MVARIACIPDWQADETLYSWTSRYHAIHGNGSARDTGSLLFGAEHASKELHAPTNLHHFVDVTHGELGDVRSIILRRTPIGLYVPFLTSQRQQVFTNRICEAKGPGWSQLCSMPASSLGDRTALRYCGDCVREDLKNLELPRWRLPHQLSGAWICVEHRQVLKTLNARGWHWTLPPITTGQDPGSSPLTPNQTVSLLRMAALSRRLVGAKPLDVTSIRQAVLVGLREYGITSWTHPLDRSQLASWFAHSPLAVWLRSATGPWRRLASGNWVHDLLRNRVGDHPLKWLLLWCTLFADEDEDASYQRFIDPCSAPHWDASGQGTIWGASSEAVPPDIQQVISEATTLKDAASSLGLTVFSLRRRLAELGTSARLYRLSRSLDHRKSQAMEAISDYIAAHSMCTRSDIHRDCKAAVSWIRANDPALFSLAVEAINDRQSRQLQLKFDHTVER